MENQVVITKIPEEVPKQRDFILKVRPQGTAEWQEIEAFQVKVDMHDVREASMIMFDFNGTVELEITFPKFYSVYDVAVRPARLAYPVAIEEKRVVLTIDQPGNFSVEINKERFHNLHVFAGAIEAAPDKNAADVHVFKGIGNSINAQIEKLPAGRTIYLEAGIYYPNSFIWQIPSETKVYLEAGAVIMGGLSVNDAHDIEIFGRGIVYQGHLPRPYFTDGLAMHHAHNITVKGLCFIDPLHYTISFGLADTVLVENVKAFSCYGWSDGLDMMSSSHITIDNCFLRNSDDCIAIYGSRWDARGDSRHIVVKNSVLWADVAHPINIGTHGDAAHDGDVMADILFENLDILEHHEYQAGYLGVFALNPGDKNTIKDVTFKNIRIDAFEHGRVFDIEVKYNQYYNPAPGRLIENIHFEDIYLTTGPGEEPSHIAGYAEDAPVRGITIKNYYRDGEKVTSLAEANIEVGDFTENIVILAD